MQAEITNAVDKLLWVKQEWQPSSKRDLHPRPIDEIIDQTQKEVLPAVADFLSDIKEDIVDKQGNLISFRPAALFNPMNWGKYAKICADTVKFVIRVIKAYKL